MKKIYVSEKDINKYRNIFGTDYSGQEQTQEYLKNVHKWNKNNLKFAKKIKNPTVNKKNHNKKETKLTDKLKWIQKNYQSIIIGLAVGFSLIYTLITIIIGGLK